MPRTHTPEFRALSREEIEAVLGRNTVARLAYTFHDRVDMTPTHYVYEDDTIYGRMAPGEKMEMLLHHPWVALEVDEVHGLFDWRSVVLKGTSYFLHAEGAPHDTAAWHRAVTVLRRLDPRFFTEDDPIPERSAIFRLRIEDMTGRAAAHHPPPP